MDDLEERWEIYPSRVGDHFAMYSVNLGVSDRAPSSELPWMNMVRVSFDAGPGGLPSGETNESLVEVEDYLHREATDRGGVQVGRLTYGGRRELFFYSATNDADQLQSALEKKFSDLHLQAFAQEDPAWSVYRDFLYPTTIDFQRIRNQHTVRALHENGDQVEKPRQIDHTASFPDEPAQQLFRAEVKQRGFTVTAERKAEDGDHPFGLQFASHGPVDLASIDTLTIPLLRRSEELGGTYDGWACAVIADD